MFDTKLLKGQEVDVRILVIEGDFTLDEKPRIDPLVSEAVECQCRGIILDLTRTRYMDSAALMVVLGIYNKLRQAGIPMAAAAGENSYAEQKIVEIGLLRVPQFEAFDSVDEAERALGRGQASRQGES